MGKRAKFTAYNQDGSVRKDVTLRVDQAGNVVYDSGDRGLMESSGLLQPEDGVGPSDGEKFLQHLCGRFSHSTYRSMEMLD